MPVVRLATRQRRLWLSYGLDWCLTIILWAAFYGLDKVNGYRRLFNINDPSLSYPYAEHERVPVWSLALIAAVFPLLVILVWAGIGRKSWFDAQVGALGLGLSLGGGSVFTNIVKVTVGRARPDILSRCQPPSTLTSNPQFGLTSWTVCTQTEKLQEGFRSFPSGHSSFAWCGMWYLMLFIAGKMRVHDGRGYTLKSWLLLVPISAATLVSVSRTMDYRHHATDVIAGAIIGILISSYTYRQYYPAISDPTCYKPYPPRIPREEDESNEGQNDADVDIEREAGSKPRSQDNGYLANDGLLRARSNTPLVAGNGHADLSSPTYTNGQESPWKSTRVEEGGVPLGSMEGVGRQPNGQTGVV